MIFDKFCGLVERHLAKFGPLAESAKLFHFEKNPHEIVPTKYENLEFLKENFFLPFRTVALEDNASMIIIHDPGPDLIGLRPMRMYIECLPLGTRPMEAYDQRPHTMDMGEFEKLRKWATAFPDEIFHIRWGLIRIDLFSDPDGQMITQAEGNVAEAIVASKNKLFQHYGPEDIERIPEGRNFTEGALINARMAMQEIVLMNQPSKFVLEIATTAMKKDAVAKKTGKITRSANRPIYMILSPREIRKIMQVPDLERGKMVSPHERRAHPRTYRNARFSNMQGQTVVIPATWVGDSEAVIGNRLYRVILDI